MKDSHGHGSDAHSSGIEQVGQPQPAYAWAKYRDTHYLVPETDQANGKITNMGRQIATVSPYLNPSQNQSGAPRMAGEPYRRGQYKAELNRSFNTGEAKEGNWALHGSVTSAKNWIASRAANSWEPPTIRGKLT
jgi:hypothetical protein